MVPRWEEDRLLMRLGDVCHVRRRIAPGAALASWRLQRLADLVARRDDARLLEWLPIQWRGRHLRDASRRDRHHAAHQWSWPVREQSAALAAGLREVAMSPL